MSVSNISNLYLLDQGLNNIQSNLQGQSTLQEQIATGEQVQQSSDDPAGYAQVQQINVESSMDTAYTNNINQGLTELNAADTAMQSIVNVAQQAHNLAVQAANGTNNGSDLNAMAQEVQGLINQLVSLGNTSVDGKSIFSGFETGQPAFTVSGQNITYQGTPSTSPYQRTVQVSSSLSVPLNVNGNDLLGNVTVTAGVPSGQGLLYDLTKLQTDMQNQDFTSINSDIDAISNDQTTVAGLQAQIGSSTDQLQAAQNWIQSDTVSQSQETSNIQSVNIAQAISSLSLQQTAYQASLGVMSKILQTSLVNFLN